MKAASLFYIILFFSGKSFAQIDEKTSDHEKYQQRINQEAQKYKDDIDRAFVDYLKQQWEAFDVYKDKKIGSDIPKPFSQPQLPDNKLDTALSNNIKTKEEEIPTTKPKSIEPKPEQKPLPNPIPIENPIKEEKESIVNYLGYSLKFNYNPKLEFNINGNSNYDIADAWMVFNESGYQSLLGALLNTKIKYNLNDWAYFELLKEVTSSIFSTSQNKQTILTWFLLNKSNYLTRIAKQGEGIALLIAYTDQIYEHSYIQIEGVNFYFSYEPDKNQQTYTYAKNYSTATRKIDANIINPILFATDDTQKMLSYEYGCKTYYLNVNYNKNAIPFYKNLPPFNISVYADANPSKNLEYSLVSEVKKLVEGKTEKVAIDMILQFVQKAFKYMTDQEQFGDEKYFFAEDIFYYEFSDCEDRAVLFTYIVRKVIGLDAVGLVYTGHMAASVKFNTYVDGDYVNYNNSRYVVCDPTYIGAHIGQAMPNYKNVEATIVPLKKY